MARTEFENEIVRLPDLAIASDILEGLTFKNCMVVGPAVIAPVGALNLSDMVFSASIEEMLILAPETRVLPKGVIGIKDCSFEGCRFDRLSIMADEPVLERLRNLVNS